MNELKNEAAEGPVCRSCESRRSFGSRVQADLSTNYADETEAARRNAMMQILSLGDAARDASGCYSDAVRHIAPRLFRDDLPSGNSDEAKVRRAAAQTSQLAGLRPAPVGDVQAALAALGDLPANATDDAKLLRASLVTKILEGRYGSADPNGYQ